MPHRQPIQRGPALLPPRKEAFHERCEMGIVRRLEKMNHLMDNKVLKAFRWFFGQIGVQADAVGERATASPFGLHALDKKPPHLHAH